MKKMMLLILSLVITFGLLAPLESNAAELESITISNSIEGLKILDNSYKFQLDSDSDIIFPEKIVEIYQGENGETVEVTEPIDDFEVSNTGITVDGKVVAQFETDQLYSACGNYKQIKTKSRGIQEYNKFLRYHPDFPGWLEVSGYYFSNSSKSISVNLGGTYGSVGVAYSPKGSGYYISTGNKNRGSRPYLRGNIERHSYDVIEKNCSGKVIRTYAGVSYAAKNIQIKIKFK